MRSISCEEMPFEVGLNVKQTMWLVKEKKRSAKQAVNLCTQLGWRKGGLKADSFSRIFNRVRQFAGDVFEQCGLCDFIAIFTHVKGIHSAVCLCANAGGVDVEAKV